MFPGIAKLALLLAADFLSVDLFPGQKASRVAVRAEATKEYILIRAQGEDAKIQTYHLIKGKYFGGNVADPGLEEMPVTSPLT